MNIFNGKNGFTIIELIVSISIVFFLSAIIMFTIGQYINSGKDNNIRANLSILIPTAERYYNTNSQIGLGYTGFCNTGVVLNVISQLSVPLSTSNCPSASRGLCCNIKSDGSAWAACIKEFNDPNQAFCVDSRGVKNEISVSSCTTSIYQCP